MSGELVDIMNIEGLFEKIDPVVSCVNEAGEEDVEKDNGPAGNVEA